MQPYVKRLEEPIICINLALRDAVRCDFWCCIDRPNPIHKACLEAAKKLTPVLISKPKNAMPRFKQAGFDFLTMIDVHEADKTWVHREKQNNIGGPRYSIVNAICWAVKYGAKKIHFHGVDMTGTGYMDGKDPRRPDPEKQNLKNWTNRWALPGELKKKGKNKHMKEAGIMQGLWRASFDHGVEFIGLPERIRP